MSGRKIAVVLFNLGGPDGPAAVKPFLRNLFSDPAIISLPAPFRQLLARLISSRREKSAQANYAMMGGGSPLLPETRKQAKALEALLADVGEVRTFIAMRYWHPLTEETARAVEAFAPDQVVLLPLYPQFSTTTTGSSLKAWKRAYRGGGSSHTVCCYPALPGVVEAHTKLLRQTLDGAAGPVRVLFSAHGLPEKVIAGGDPYQKQVEATVAAVVASLGGQVDHVTCYQSRVGPLKWIGPSTVEAIEQACKDGVSIVVSPIAFVSDHIETLVELDHEYRELAAGLGCKDYRRVPALGVEPAFIDGLAGLVRTVLGGRGRVAPGEGWTPAACGPICPCREAA